MEKFDTCFFERYARITLAELLDPEFGKLMNRDRPDLQSPDHVSMGIEVTRAMEESRRAEQLLLGEMAGIEPCGDDLRQIHESGYGYGLTEASYIGRKEYEYWALALPMKRILENKIRKAANGFYGRFDQLGLYIFSKDDLTDGSVSQICTFVTELQARPAPPYQGEIKEPGIKDHPENGTRYTRLYLSEVSNLYVCSLSEGYTKIKRCPISMEQRKEFFMKALWTESR